MDSSFSSVPSSYREEQVSFVTGLTGTTIERVLCLFMQLASVTAFLKILSARLGRWSPCFPVLEVLVMAALPTLLVTSPLAEWPGVCLTGLTSATFVIGFIISPHVSQLKGHDGGRNGREKGVGIANMAITYFRACTLVLTAVCILAVDFRVFPRSLAKTEHFGVSLMDLGTGVFIFSSALTSSYARHGGSGSRSLSSSSTRKHVATNVVTLMLGFGRLVALKATAYQEHVSEYGVHWNFFVTLFSVWTLADVFRHLLPSDGARSLSACLILTTYQYLLVTDCVHGEYNDLSGFIFNAGRESSFFAANREGICSLAGYFPLYILTEIFSRHYVFAHVTASKVIFVLSIHYP